MGLEDMSAEDLLKKNQGFFKGLEDTEEEFIYDVVDYVREHKKTIDQMIEKNLIGWKLDRLLPMERNLLRMGIAEASFNDQKAIIIDDIVRVAKKYGGEESFKIVNAILDKVIG
jgi:N utilization substance protein B